MLNMLKEFLYHKFFLSVIIPNYNNEDFIEECLNSVLGQTYTNIEIIVCDDASTDKSVEILKKYESRHKNIQVIYNKKNMGVSNARHKAILEAKGNYLTTLDSDDYFKDKNKLKMEMQLIAKYKKLDKDIIAFSNVDVVNVDGKFISNYQGSKIAEGDLLIPILSRSCMIPRDFIFSIESYYKTGGFDLNINLFEDWDLKIRLANICEFYYTGITGVAYRRKGYGLSYANKINMANAINHVFKKNLKLIKSKVDFDFCEEQINFLLAGVEKG